MTDKISQYAAAATFDLFDGDMTGAQARSIRERLGLSESWFAEALGVNVSVVTKWEHSSHAMPYPAADALFQVYQRTRHAVAALAADFESGAEYGPIVTFRTDQDYTEETSGPYSAAWHRAVAGRVDDVTGCGVVYG